MAVKERAHFGSKLGLVLAAAGSAVGLGNIWRFPYEAGQNGGGAFLLVYVLFSLLIGLPIMITELSIGRRAQSNAVKAFEVLVPGKAGKRWSIIGVMGVFCAFFIMGFYTVVSGWTVEYIYASLTNELAGKSSDELRIFFDAFSKNSWRPVFWLVLFVVFCYVIVAAGIKEGIEKYSKILMPMLFFIIIVLCIRSLTLPGSKAGVDFLFNPDFSKLNSSVILSALGQSFFSLSLGMGCLITYGSYVDRKTNLATTSLEVTVLDTAVAVLSGVAIFPALFALNIAPNQGPELVFITLPSVFQVMPGGGYVWSLLFFVLLAIAALTSCISLFEVVVTYVTETFNMSRKKAMIIISLLIVVLGSLCSLSLGVWREYALFGMTLFDLMDFVSAKILLPLGGLLMSIFFGWFYKTEYIREELSNGGQLKLKLFNVYLFILKYVVPVAILLVFLNELGLF